MPLARAAARRRRRRDGAVALQLAGVGAFASPFVDVFGAPGRILGLPAGALLLFVLWFGLIALAARQARGEAGQARGEGGGG